MKYVFALFTFLTFFTFAIAQKNIKHQKFVTDSTLCQKLMDSAKSLLSSNNKISEKLYLKAIKLSRDNNLYTLQALAHKNLAIIYSDIGDTENIKKSIRCNKTAVKIYRKIGDSLGVFKTYNNLSTVYNQSLDYSSGLDYSIKAADLIKVLNKKQKLNLETGASYGALGYSYRRLQLYDSAIANYQRAKKYVEAHNAKLSKDKRVYFDIYMTANIGQVYLTQKQYEKAYVNFSEAYDALRDTDDSLAIAQISNYLGNLLMKTKAYDKSKEYLLESLKISRNNQFDLMRMIALNKLAKLYYSTKKTDSSLYYTDTAIDFGKRKGFASHTKEAYEIKAIILEKKGDSIGSLKYYRVADQIQDSIQRSEKKAKAMTILSNKKQKDLEGNIDNLNSEILQKNKLLYWVLFTTAFLSVLVLIYWKYLHKKVVSASNEKINHKELSQLKREKASSSVNNALKEDLLLKVNKLLEAIKEDNKTDLNQQITETQGLIKYQLDLDKNWDQFFVHFEKVHPKFIENLKQKHNLSANELRLSAFLKMNLSYKEIGQLLNITQSSLHVTVHRLKKKLHLPKDKNVFDFLHGLTS